MLVPYAGAMMTRGRSRMFTTLLRNSAAMYRRRTMMRRAKAGLATARFVMNNRSSFMRAVAAMRRRRRARFSSRNVGEHPRSNPARTNTVVNTDLVNKNTRTLYSENITNLEQGTGIGQRDRRVANISGWKFCIELKSLSNDPLYANLAVIAPKDSAGGGVPVEDFFRSSTSTNNRAVDFGIALNSNELHCLPINTDRYTVLKHQRHRIIPQGSGTTTTVSLNGFSYKNLSWWVPFRRQIRYEDNTTPEAGNVYFVYWFDRFGANSGAAVATAEIAMTTRIITYFRHTVS